MDPHSFIARAEAQRWLGIAEKLLMSHDLVGSKTFAIRARDSDPRLEAADQILAIADTLLAAEKRVVGNNGDHQPDFYAILQLVRFAQDTDHITSQYRRLAVMLNPHQNRFPYSDQAFQLVNDAWAVLSNPLRKSMYDSELDFPPQQQQMNSIGFNLEQQQQQQHHHHHQQQQHHQHQQQHQHNFFSINHMSSGHEQELPEPPPQTFQSRVQHSHQQQQQQLQQHNFLSQPNPVRPLPVREQDQLFQHREQEQLFQPQPQPQVQPFQVTSAPPQQQTRPSPQPPQPQLPMRHPTPPPPQPQPSPPPPAAPPQPPFSWPQAPPLSQPQQSQQQQQQHLPPQPQPQQQQQQHLQPHSQPQQQLQQQLQEKQHKQQVLQEQEQQESLEQSAAPIHLPSEGNGNNGVRDEEIEIERETEEAAEEEVDDDSPTFWTACPFCFYMYEYPKVYSDCTLRCDNCKRAYQAVRIPSLPPIIEGQEACFYCWGFFPLGVSMSHLEKENGKGTRSKWTPFSPLYQVSSNVQDHLNGRAAPKENLFVNKSSGPRIYIDDITDDVFMVISEPSDSDDSDADWRRTKKQKVKRMKKALEPGFKMRAQVLAIRARDARNGSVENLQDAIPVQEVVGVATVPMAESSKKSVGNNPRKQSGWVAKELGKLDLNVEFNNNEGEEPAPRTSVGNRGHGHGQGEEDNIEGIGFFEGLDEFLSSLPILSVVNEEKVKAA